MIEFLRFAMHEDPLALGLMIFILLAALIGGPALLISNSKGNHMKQHQFHSELMCDYCQARRREHGVSAYERWPMRVHGERPPRGTG